MVCAMVQAMAKKYQRKRKQKGPNTLSGAKFSGILLEPMKLQFLPEPIGTSHDVDKRINAIRTAVVKNLWEQRADRIGALLEHYNIPPGDNEQTFFRLALKLAEDFIPAFSLKPPKKNGRPKMTFSAAGGEALFNAVNAHLDKHGGTAADACTHLNAHGPKSFRYHGADRLLDNYLTFRAAAIMAHKNFVGQHPEWEAIIDAIGYDAIIAQAATHKKPKG